MAAGDLAAAFDGVAADTAQGFESAAGSVAEFLGQTASKQEQNVENLLAADGAAARAAADIGGKAGSVVQAGGRPGISIGEVDLEGLPTEQADFIRYLARTYGDRFVVHDWTPGVRSNIRDLSLVPPSVHERVAQFLNEKGGNAGLYFGEGGVAGLDNLGHLALMPPRGWPEGSSWDSVGGIYSENTNVLAVGTAKHASASAPLHEYGHLIENAYLYHIYWNDSSVRSGWFSTHQNVVNDAPPGSISPYYLQQGGGGQQEMFAEAFARYHLPGPEGWLTHLAGSPEGGQALKHYFDTLLRLS
jgi:hypothetical protein